MEEKVYGYWLPLNVSAHSDEVDFLINWIHWFMLALFLGWGVYFIYCLIRFRQGANPQATYGEVKGKTAKYVEVIVVIVEAALLIAISIPAWSSFKHDFPSDSESLTVRIIAEQFAWNIHYPGKDGIFGRTAPDLITAENLLGLDPDDAAGKDDFNSINQLHVPVNKPLIVRLSAKDVIHSFKIPVMRITQDAIPGSEIRIWMEANKTGKFDLACAQLCGLGHYRMRGEFHVETLEDFEAWLIEQEPEEEGEFVF